MRTVMAAGHVAAMLGFALLAGGMFAAPVKAQSVCGASVTVAAGDTLSRIAARCGTTISALLQANPQIGDPSTIRVGQTVRMPGSAFVDPRGQAGPPFLPPSQPRFSGPPPFQPPAAEGTYIVRPGDTLAAIADRLGIPLAQLISANPNLDPRFLRPGLVLRVPAGARPVERIPRDFAPPRSEAVLLVDPPFARRGSSVELAAHGLPPNSRARILGGTSPDDLVVLDRAGVDRRGRLIAEVDIPDWARPGRPFYFAVETRWPPAEAISEPIRIAGDWRGPGRGGELTIIGTMTREGVECPAVRGDDGRLYTLAGDVRGFRPGDRVRVEGWPAQVSVCMQGTTIEVSRILPMD